MKFSEYPIVKLLLSLIIGILLAKFDLISSFSWYWILPFILLLALLALPAKYYFSFANRYLVGFTISVLFVLLGYSLFRYNYNFEKQKYFANYLPHSKSVQLKIIEPPLEKTKSVKIIAKVEGVYVDSAIIPTIGKVIVYLQKDSFSKNLKYGDIIANRSKISRTQPPQNPDQFNYKSYLHFNGINYQAYSRSGDWELIKNAGISPMGFALLLRKKLIKVLYNNNVQDDELSVAAGMLLGVRDMLSPELQRAYAGAGAMHILCVSGLHVGIIFMILSWFLNGLSKSKKSKNIKSLIILIIIWFYAMLTGFSPSVVRSATMFSFIVVGQGLNRHVNIIGSISSSAFVLLIIDPSLIFNLGFQLSYSAVLSIVILQKPLANIWVPQNKVLYYIWQLVAVSVAAQIGTAPLSVYYFHQFPNLFIITNLIVIPAAYVIIMLGISVIIVSFIPLVSAFFGKLLSLFLSLINYLISNIEAMSFAVSRDLYISPQILFLSILLVISMSIWLLQGKKNFVFVNLVLIVLILIAANFNYDSNDEFIIYKTSKSKYMAIYSNNEAWIIGDSAVIRDPQIASFSVSGHELRKGIKKRNYYLMGSKFMIKNNNFIINYPYLKFGETIIALNNENRDTLLVDVNYYVYHSYTEKAIEPTESGFSWIITPNIPPWEVEKIIPKLDSLGIKSHHIKNDGAWSLKF